MLAFSNEGKIYSVDEREVRVRSADTRSEVVLSINKVVEFGYLDNRNVTGVETKYEHCLMAFFSPVIEEGDPDSLSFGIIQA